MLKLKLQSFGHLMWRDNSLEKTRMLGKIEGRRRRGWQRMKCWMASLTQWTWVWENSGRCWKTRKPGVLQSMGLQRVGHDWVTEQWTTTRPWCPHYPPASRQARAHCHPHTLTHNNACQASCSWLWPPSNATLKSRLGVHLHLPTWPSSHKHEQTLFSATLLRTEKRKILIRKAPCGFPGIQRLSLHLPMQGVRVLFPVGELRSYMPGGQKTKT